MTSATENLRCFKDFRCPIDCSKKHAAVGFSVLQFVRKKRMILALTFEKGNWQNLTVELLIVEILNIGHQGVQKIDVTNCKKNPTLLLPPFENDNPIASHL